MQTISSHFRCWIGHDWSLSKAEHNHENQGLSQDCFRRTHNSPNRSPLLPPPPHQSPKTFLFSLIKDLVTLKTLEFFFPTYEVQLANCKILCRVFRSIDWCTSIICLTFGQFCYWVRFVVFKQIQRVNKNWTVPIWSSLSRFWIRNLE